MKNNYWSIFFFEDYNCGFNKRRLLKETEPDYLPHVFGRMSAKLMVEGACEFSINDLLHIEGKPYRIERFDIHSGNCEVHVCVVASNNNDLE